MNATETRTRIPEQLQKRLLKDILTYGCNIRNRDEEDSIGNLENKAGYEEAVRLCRAKIETASMVLEETGVITEDESHNIHMAMCSVIQDVNAPVRISEKSRIYDRLRPDGDFFLRF